MNRRYLIIISLLNLLFVQKASAFSFKDLWVTKDQQAKEFLRSGQFARAANTFGRDDWKAVASYRLGDYGKAATLYQQDKSKDAAFNLGNTYAQMGRYEEAIKAYDKELAINPNHEDAKYNRKIVEDLLKKDKEQQQDKQQPDKDNQDSNDQDKQENSNQNNNQDSNDQDKQENSNQNNNQDKQDQDKQNQDNKAQDKKDEEKQKQDKHDEDQQNQDKSNQENQAQSAKSREQQQADEQWLSLIPDEPGNLLREKFLRDYLRRQHGWGK